MEDWPELTIGEVARRAGVATSSIRYYESIGLLPEPERVSGQRRYRTDVLGTLGFIGIAQAAGFKLREIRQLLEGLDGQPGMAESMRLLSQRKLPEVRAELERAEARKSWLETASECTCETPDECTLFPDAEVPAAASLPVVRVSGGGCRRAPQP